MSCWGRKCQGSRVGGRSQPGCSLFREMKRPICTNCIHSSSMRDLHLTLQVSAANLHFQKTSILLKTFGFSFYFEGSFLQIVFEDMEKGQTSTKSTVLQQGQ